jgi:predicted nucleic acid-binding protein
VITFVDTSALLAVLDADDDNHEAADRAWRELLAGDQELMTSSYVIVETFALVQARLGMAAVASLARDLMPVLDVQWIDAPVHEAAVALLLTAGRRRLSLVDCASFAVMRLLAVERAFAFDRHFREQGFTLMP